MENDPEDTIVDRAYEVMSDELHHWRIVGPLEERRGNMPPRTFWNAVRDNASAIHDKPDNTIIHLTTREHAVACVQWHGLKAVITALKGELGPSLAVSGNDNTGD